MKSRPQPDARSGQASPRTHAGEAGSRQDRLAAWPSRRSWRLGLRVAGAALLAATGAIHLDLYLTGHRSIPTLGWLFLLQVITAFALAAAVLATGSRVVAAADAGSALATLGGYLLSMWAGLFGFTEIRTSAGIAAGVIELAGIPGPGRAVADISLAALVLVGISVALAGGPAPAPPGRGALKTAKIGGVTVLTNAQGFTLYWFAPDTVTRSNCKGSARATGRQ